MAAKSTETTASAPAQGGELTMPGYDLQGEEPGVQPRVSTEAKRWSPDDPIVKPENLNWRNGLATITAAHGANLTERARETIRRALGELYQEFAGAEPASETAHKVAENLGNADELNRIGDEQHMSEHDSMNQHGQALFAG